MPRALFGGAVDKDTVSRVWRKGGDTRGMATHGHRGFLCRAITSLAGS